MSLHSVFGILGNVTGLFLFLSPMPTFWGIYVNKGTEQFSGIPYVMTLLNCSLSAWYGMPFVSPNNTPVIVVNAVGVVIEALYVITFFIYSPKNQKTRILGFIFVISLIIFGGVALVSVFALHHQKRKIFCGFAAAISGVIMYGSPLSVMWMVIQTRSVQYMPFLLSFCGFLCGTSWFVYGLLGDDLFVTVPNGIGCVLGLLQMILYLVYRGDNCQNMQTTDDGSAVELEQANG